MSQPKPTKPLKISQWVDSTGRNPFVQWMEGLDRTFRVRVEKRLARLRLGNPGDHQNFLQAGVCELRIDVGPGLRVYYGKDGDHLVILLAAGDKKTQRKDIEVAQARWANYLAQTKGGKSAPSKKPARLNKRS